MLKEGLLCGALTATALAAGGADNTMETMPPGMAAAMAAAQQGGGEESDYPPFEKVVEGLEKVISTTDGAKPLWELYADKETGKLLAALPGNYNSQMLMIACTVSGGDSEAGVMGPTYYAKWRKIDKQLALVAPNLSVRTEGDKQAKDSIEHLFTGSVITALPIVTMGPSGGPVIDLGKMATTQTSSFFGASAFGAYGPNSGRMNASLATLTKAKAFPENIIVEYEMPDASGRFVRLTYSIGSLEGTPGFKPRKADPRVGYFYDWHQDFARTSNQDVTDRYISRWHIEKADPSLSKSPPKEPIVWYIEHTTPIKFRRYVREGIALWNSAFEKVGIIGALEVYQQDSSTGAHMNIDPEDARYNFFRWNASNHGYAIGPSRTNPFTGEILDADVVWHQGLTRSVRNMLESLSEDVSEDAFDPETLAFFQDHPNWDPRVRLASPARRAQLLKQRELEAIEVVEKDLADRDHPWTHGLNDPTNTACRIGNLLALDMSLFDAAVAADLLDTESSELLDGLPEEFIGPMIRYISAHEVGHCLGLQHNMAASTIHTLEEINSEGFTGPTVGSVMDYVAANINHECGEIQGPYASPVVGPYDDWAIAYGYGPEDKLEEVLAKVSEPENIFVSQIAMFVGQDPRNMTWDMGADNLQFCKSRLGLVKELRGKITDSLVKDGESWAVARRRYASLLGTHFAALNIAANWVGSSYWNNDFKGDPGDRAPIEDVPAAKQREALNLIVEHAFNDEAFGLTPELMRHLGKEYWWDPAGFNELVQDPSFTLHDVVGAVQAAALTLVMNPTRLRRVYDNEYRAIGAPDDVLTVSEVIATVTDAIWDGMDDLRAGRASAGDPAVSSIRRNLQREHVDRLIDLALLDDTTSPSLRTISTLATKQLKRVDGVAKDALAAKPDPYTVAHLEDVRTRIDKAMEAAYVIGR